SLPIHNTRRPAAAEDPHPRSALRPPPRLPAPTEPLPLLPTPLPHGLLERRWCASRPWRDGASPSALGRPGQRRASPSPDERRIAARRAPFAVARACERRARRDRDYRRAPCLGLRSQTAA